MQMTKIQTAGKHVKKMTANVHQTVGPVMRSQAFAAPQHYSLYAVTRQQFLASFVATFVQFFSFDEESEQMIYELLNWCNSVEQYDLCS